MKRIIVITLTVVICFLLQTTVFQWFALANIVPNLLIIITASIGFMRGRTEALFTGLLCGLLVDCMYGDIIGLCGLCYMLIGYISGFANIIYLNNDYTLPIFVIGFADLLYCLVYYAFTFLLRSRLNIFYYFRRIMIPELIYTVLVSLVLYKLLYSLNGLLEKFEQKEA